MTTTITVPTITSKQFEAEVKEGFIFILNHLEGLWPRMISTYATGGAQRQVYSFEEVMARFKAANFLDCRISAYPKYTDYYINNGIAPTVLMVDLDIEHFKSIEEFELAAAKTYTNFHNILGSRPTQLFTGGGMHYIQPQSVPVLENINEFSKFDQPSRKFLEFEERRLTDNKADQSHWSTVSFNNMMLRVPGSLNSSCIQFDEGRIKEIEIPYDARVRIEKYWDGNIPDVKKVLLMQYRNYLQFSAIRVIHKQKDRRVYGRARSCNNIHDYDWIERLFDKPINDFRKYCIWRVFVPYFINVQGLSRLEAFRKISSWLDRCNSVSRLGFNPTQKINYELDHVAGYRPIRQHQLKEGHPMLYALLEKEEILC